MAKVVVGRGRGVVAVVIVVVAGGEQEDARGEVAQGAKGRTLTL